MSIHPRYAERILAGTKRVEFRKRPIADDVTHVIIYATAPVSAVIGAFTVKDQHTLNPQKLWSLFREVGGIAWADFNHYYDGRTSGTGITVGEVLQASEPMSLQDDFGIAYPPQSFQYLCADAARSAISAMSPSWQTLTRRASHHSATNEHRGPREPGAAASSTETIALPK